jgi:23S rRNA (cytidine1920-2'-O)/16S rRNA (cytidine1409-2'-O)-methyltransferase
VRPRNAPAQPGSPRPEGVKSGKSRLDQLLVERGLAESGSQARALILAGKVFAGTRRLDKPGMMLPADGSLEVKGPAHPYVSRGGLKLAQALDAFAIDPAGLVCLDIGASTGGFTDVLLSRGAARVYAVDVGLAVVLPAPLRRLKPGGRLVALIKPQFEVGPEHVGKGGVVRDPAQHEAVCARIRALFETEFRLNVIGLVESPILGPEGNREFLIGAQLHPGS